MTSADGTSRRTYMASRSWPTSFGEALICCQEMAKSAGLRLTGDSTSVKFCDLQELTLGIGFVILSKPLASSGHLFLETAVLHVDVCCTEVHQVQVWWVMPHHTCALGDLQILLTVKSTTHVSSGTQPCATLREGLSIANVTVWGCLLLWSLVWRAGEGRVKVWVYFYNEEMAFSSLLAHAVMTELWFISSCEGNVPEDTKPPRCK